MSEHIFKLRNVLCSYDGIKPVLEIEHLDIPAGQLIVMVGKSGAGKSTILETLGLMNQTVMGGTIDFCPVDTESFSLDELWMDHELLADVRNRYFSFIFQDTNLMPNFTAVENACIPQLLQGVSMREAEEKVALAMDQVGLLGLEEDARVFELSGGQRQRLAFVRAITPDFRILFGDEPTGNLDKNNSFELLKVIKHYIHEHQRSSIIVSHDLDLSMEFADQIIVLTKDGDVGKVLAENIFCSKEEAGIKEWHVGGSEPISDLREILNQKIR